MVELNDYSPLEEGLNQLDIEGYLYNLHKKIWSGSQFNAKRYEEYALAVWDYMRNGIDVKEHRRFVEEYKIFVLKKEAKEYD